MGNVWATMSKDYHEKKESYETFFVYHFETFLNTHFIKDPEGYVARETYYDAWLAYCNLNNLEKYRETFTRFYYGSPYYTEWFKSQPSFQIHSKTYQGLRLVSFPTKPNECPDAPPVPSFVI